MVVWSDEGGNGVNFYTSRNLLDWTFASRYQADWLFECPNLVAMPLDGDPSAIRWMLHAASGEYVVGDFDGYLHWMRLDNGEFAARERAGRAPLRGPLMVADGILVVQNTEGDLSAWRVSP